MRAPILPESHGLVRATHIKRTANLNWSFKLQQVRLAHENFLGSEAKLPDFLLGKLDLFARSTVADVQQAVDDVVKKSLLLH